MLTDVGGTFDVFIYISTLRPLCFIVLNFNFHSLEVVSRYRDPQLPMTEIFSVLVQSSLQVNSFFATLSVGFSLILFK